MSIDLSKVTLVLSHNMKSRAQGEGDSDSDEDMRLDNETYESDDEDEHPWLCTLVFRIQVKNRQVGSILVHIIKRGQMAPGGMRTI